MPRNRSARLVFALTIVVMLCFIARNLYRRYLNTALVAAIKAQNVAAVRSLLNHGANPDYKFLDEGDRVPLPKPMLELAFSRLEPFTGLAAMEKKFHPPVKPNTGANVLNPNAEAIVCLLIRKGAQKSKLLPYLQRACQVGDVPVTHCLLDQGIDLRAADTVNSVFSKALTYATTSPFIFSYGGGQSMDPAAQKVEMERRRAVSRQLVQLLREHGAHLTLTQVQEFGDTAAATASLHQNTLAGTREGYYALCKAAEQGNLKQIRQLLKAGVAMSPPSSTNINAFADAPLRAAAACNRFEAVKLLLAHGADPNQKTPYSATPLTDAARTANLEMVKLLLAHGAKINAGNSYTSPLLSAISAGHANLARFLLARGADPNSVLAAALRSAPALTPELLKHGAKVNPYPARNNIQSRMQQGPTSGPISPLINALWYAPQYEALLLRAGANIGPDRSIGCVAAARGGRAELIPNLLAYGADINGMDIDQESALSLCIVHAPKSVRMLLEHGANPNAVNQNQPAPLQLAIITGNAETVRLLLQHGANPNAHAVYAHTALYWARKQNKADIVAMLQRAGARE